MLRGVAKGWLGEAHARLGNIDLAQAALAEALELLTAFSANDPTALASYDRLRAVLLECCPAPRPDGQD